MKDPTILPSQNHNDDEDDSQSTSSSTDSNTSHSRTPQSATPCSPPSTPSQQRSSNSKSFLPTIPTAPPSSMPRLVVSSTPQVVTSSSARHRSRVAASRVMTPNHHYTPTTGAIRIAIDMRTRSSRLFFVLLHLVGVSTIVPSSSSSGDNNTDNNKSSSSSTTSGLLAFLRQHIHYTWSPSTLIGVHPTPILLTRLHVESSRRGLKGILERVERIFGWDGNIDLLGEPYWFQDNVDGRCLDPDGGFSECGDATLWRVKRRPLTKRQVRERGYRRRHRVRMEEKREKKRRKGADDSTSQQQQESEQSSKQPQPTIHEGGSSSVCVWPFFCEEDSQFLQTTQFGTDEIYGYEYENYEEEEEEGFALQLMDVDAMTANSSFSSYRTSSSSSTAAGLKEEESSSASKKRHNRLLFWNSNNHATADPHAQDCLLSFPPNNNNDGATLQIGSCSSEAAWVWHVNRDGILVRGFTKAEKKKRKRGSRWKISHGRATSAAVAAAGGGGTLNSHPQADFECVHRANSTLAMLLPCDNGDGRKEQTEEDGTSLVGFSLVRYPSTFSKSAHHPRRRPVEVSNDAEPSWEPWTTLEGPSAAKDSKTPAATTAEGKDAVGANNIEQQQHLPTSHTSSQDHASVGAKLNRNKVVDVKSTTSMLHTSLEQGGMLHTSLEQGEGSSSKSKKGYAAATTSASHIRDAPVAMNGVAFHKQRMNKKQQDGGGGGENKGDVPSIPNTERWRISVADSVLTIKKGPSPTKLQLNNNNKNKSKNKKKDGGRNNNSRNVRSGGGGGGQTPIHDNPSEANRQGEHDHHHGHTPDSNPHPPRKIPVHPYIQSSKDFVWVDPLTSLEYPTDLCRYLGHTKKEAGRHTLMGVGQYYRTAFNIKVYGAALYVAKRDVLADPKFGEYAPLSSEDLRNRDDFYEHLMNMPSQGEVDPSNSIGGFFDRTLFIKINMQLSTDAMRKSLEADWSLLTTEMKTLIIDSSFQEREADERMQQKIQSKENSSNCSCGQVAPPEFLHKTDPTCCARGTELVFTWRKNGNFEIRLDGRVVDIFPRPDIARGIFGEYLNDHPISTDAKSHFTDGFPFLLAPLAQVKGMSSAVPSHTHEGSTTNKKPKSSSSPSSHNPMHRLMDAAVNSVGAVNTQAHTLSKWMQDGAAGMSSTALGGAMGVARGLSEELDRQRMELVDNAVALQKEGMEMLSSLIKQSTEEENNGVALTIVNQAMPSLSPFSNGFDTYNNDDVGLKTSAAPSAIMPDEIGIKIEPTMNFTHQLFFTTVHVYLLLLFVLSLPGSYTTRLVVKRRILETKKFVESQSQGAFAAMSKFH